MKTELEITIEDDELYSPAVALIRESGRASPSFLQRNFMIGYNRAARLMEAMESENIISPPDDKGSRTVNQHNSGKQSEKAR